MEPDYHQLNLPSDLYSRNACVSRILEAYRAYFSLGSLKVLDVGGRNGKMQLFLSPDDELTLLDLRSGDEENLVVGDATQMYMFEDGAFDVVISGDVLEHVPAEKREAFLSECQRVSGGLVMHAAPFYSREVQHAEDLVHEYYRQLKGEDHEWLQEHEEYGLPNLDDVAAFAKRSQSHYMQFPSNDLENWVLLQLMVFYAYRFGVPAETLVPFYRAYNRSLFQVEDFSQGSYRQIVVLSREPFQVELPYVLDASKRSQLRVKVFGVLSDFAQQFAEIGSDRLGLVRDLQTNLQDIQQLLEQADRDKQSLSDQLRQHENTLSERDKSVRTLEESVYDQQLLVRLKDQHIRNVEGFVKDRDRQISELKREASRFQSRLKAKDEHLDHLKEILERHRGLIQDLQHERREKDSEMKTLEADLQLQSEVLEHQSDDLAMMTSQMSVLKRERLRSRQKMRSLAFQLEGKDGMIHDLTQALEAESQVSELLREDLKELARERERLLGVVGEYEHVKRSVTHRFLAFHRSITQWVLKFFRDMVVGLKVLMGQGPRAFLTEMKRYFFATDPKNRTSDGMGLNEQYQLYLSCHRLTAQHLKSMRKESQQWDYRPLVSIIVPVYNVEPRWLDRAIGSLMAQCYDNWELCLYDDASSNEKTRACLRKWEKKVNRIRVQYGSENRHISFASNQALAMARGEFVGLLDHDDELTPDALYEVVKALNEDLMLDFIYSDEDKIDMKGTLLEPHFKPDWSPETFESMMYTCHFAVFRKHLLLSLGGFREGYEGSQDYDLVLRVTEKTDRIHHIPKVLYHWRMIPGSAAAAVDAKSYAYEAAQKALSDHLTRNHELGRVHRSLSPGHYRVQRNLPSTPLVSVIVPFRDEPDLLEKCLQSLLNSTYRHYEVILISNNTSVARALEIAKSYQTEHEGIRLFEYNLPFNYSEINNWAVTKSRGEYLLFLNNDTEVITPGWMEAMLEYAQRPEIGAVGAKLLYPDKTIQHAGVVLGIGGVAAHAFKGFHDESIPYFGYGNVVRNCSAVTAACLMVSRQQFLEVGGFNEGELPVAFNDVDLCLKLMKAGYRNVYTPFAKLFHHESVSRGSEDTEEKRQRFAAECAYMRREWQEWIEKDPYYNPNLTLHREDYSLHFEASV